MMKNRQTKGFSLVELLVGLTLGLLLTQAAVQSFIFLKTLYRYHQGLSRIQENIQAADNILGPMIRGAGKFGCVDLHGSVLVNVIDNTNIQKYGLSPAYSLMGSLRATLVQAGLLSQSVFDRMLPHSDVLWVKTAQDIYPIVKTVEPDTDQITVFSDPDFVKDELIFIGDCQRIDFFKLKADSFKIQKNNQTIIPLSKTLSAKLGKVYDIPAVVGRVASVLYYVGDTRRKNYQGDPVLALYQTDLNGRTQELIEGVELMRLYFGVIEKEKIQYFSSDNVKNWSLVVTVKVVLLLNSVESARALPEAYSVDGKRVVPNDKLIRRWWTQEWGRRNARFA